MAMKFDFATIEIRMRINEILKRPMQPGWRRAVSQLSGRNELRYLHPNPMHGFVETIGGPMMKGTRHDGVTLGLLASAINTGRATPEEVRSILGEMFGAEHAGAWDRTISQLYELMAIPPRQRRPKR